MTHSYVWHDPFICVIWLIHVCDMTHSYVWRASFIRVTWLIHVYDMTHSYVWHDWFVYVYMWHDSFICVTWLIHMCDMTHPYVWHDVSICVTWLIHMCDMTQTYDSFVMTHSYVCHVSSIWLIQMCYIPYYSGATNENRTFEIQVIFSKVNSLLNLLYKTTIELTLEKFTCQTSIFNMLAELFKILISQLSLLNLWYSKYNKVPTFEKFNHLNIFSRYARWRLYFFSNISEKFALLSFVYLW